MVLSKTKLQDFRKELRILLKQKGYTNDQIKCLIFKPEQYIRFAYPRFEEFHMTVHDCNDGDMWDNNVDRDLLKYENEASDRVFGHGVFSYTTLKYLVYEANYQGGFAEDKAVDEYDWIDKRVHLSDARSFFALEKRAKKNLMGIQVEQKERIGFRKNKKSNSLREGISFFLKGTSDVNPEYKKCKCPSWFYFDENGKDLTPKYSCEYHKIK